MKFSICLAAAIAAGLVLAACGRKPESGPTPPAKSEAPAPDKAGGPKAEAPKAEDKKEEAGAEKGGEKSVKDEEPGEEDAGDIDDDEGGSK